MTFLFNGQVIEAHFNDQGICWSKEVYRQIHEATAEMKTVCSGMTGGHHGTDHGTETYRDDNGQHVTIVRPGHLERGYIELYEYHN